MSDVINDKFGTSIVLNTELARDYPKDYTIYVNADINLDNKEYYIALEALKLSYSRFNIDPKYGNDTIKYSHDTGTTWKGIEFPEGLYRYKYIQYVIKEAF